MFITHEMLTNRHACKEQVEEFRKAFPQGTEVTTEVCVQYARVFNYSWAADTFLPYESRKAYRDKIKAAYETYAGFFSQDAEGKRFYTPGDYVYIDFAEAAAVAFSEELDLVTS